MAHRPRSHVCSCTGLGMGANPPRCLRLPTRGSVRAVASVWRLSRARYPSKLTLVGDTRVPLLFPAGLGDLVAYRGRSAQFEAIRRVDFWIVQPQGLHRLDPRPGGGPWLDSESNGRDRANEFASSMQSVGARVELVESGNEGCGTL